MKKFSFPMMLFQPLYGTKFTNYVRIWLGANSPSMYVQCFSNTDSTLLKTSIQRNWMHKNRVGERRTNFLEMTELLLLGTRRPRLEISLSSTVTIVVISVWVAKILPNEHTICERESSWNKLKHFQWSTQIMSNVSLLIYTYNFFFFQENLSVPTNTP